MSVFSPESDHAALRITLARPDALLVACFCAAWCDTCEIYRPRFEALARARPQHGFAWIDIEDHAEFLGDEDVENFPTLLIQSDKAVLFYGPMLPHIGHLERLLDSLDEVSSAGPAIGIRLPDVRAMLGTGCAHPES
jgi:thioredoxin 1